MSAPDPFAPLPRNGSTARVHRQKEPFARLPVPEGAAPPDRHPTLGVIAAKWPYHTSEAGLDGYQCRFDLVNGTRRKEIRPLRYGLVGGRAQWHWRGWAEGRPLYRLPAILAAKPQSDLIDGRPAVLVCEGEKAADAAARLFPDLTATTPMNGAESPGKTDWSPLKGREVLIWPDNDEAGQRFGEQVAHLAQKAGAVTVRVVRVPGHFPEKWDLADPVPDGTASESLRDLLSGAEPWQAEPAAAVKAAALDKAGQRGGSFLVLRAGIEDEAGNRHGPGVYFRSVSEDKETGEKVESWSWFVSLLEIVAETRNHTGEQWGRLVVVTDRDGTRHEWAMPMGMLAGDGTAYREHLLSLGLELAPGKNARDMLHMYLTMWRPEERARCVDRVGWHGPAFILPDATFGNTKGEQVLLQTAGTAPAFECSGVLSEWRDEIARFAVGNSRLALALSAPFASPLVHLVGDENGGFHIAGGSSTGKTTLLACAASAWGVPVQSWRTTDNAAEALARGACDALLCLDEVSQADGRAVDAMAYMLGNGAGKARMRRDATARALITWRLIFISTGELGLAAKMQEAGRRARAGQEVRVIEIPADAGKGLGAFEELHAFASADALARHLRLAADRLKGAPARVFLAAIAESPDEVAETVRLARQRWLEEHVPLGVDGQVSRVARRFGLLAAAGELAVELGILPWPAGEADRAAARCFTDWLRARGGTGSAELREGIAQVRSFIEAHGSSRFEPAWARQDNHASAGDAAADGIRRTINRAGFRRLDGEPSSGRWTYYVLTEAWRNEVCQGLDHKAIAREMHRCGWLSGDAGHHTRKERIPGHGGLRVYVIGGGFLEHEASAARPEATF